MRNALLLLSIFSFGVAARADDASPPSATPTFALREMDMHLHAGLERRLPMSEWLNLSVADGRKAVLLLDHIELYRQKPAEYDAWAAEDHLTHWYAMGSDGHRQLFADMDKAASEHQNLLVFKGWEIAEFELDEGLETAPMALAEVIGWHISPNHDGDAPDGRLLLKRIEQIKSVQKQFPVPMIVFHPFSMRIEHLNRAAKKAGRTLTTADYRFFQPGEQEELIRRMKGASLYIEMPRGVEAYWDNPVIREAIIADVKPLAEAGVKFTVSTDAHTPDNLKQPFHPERYCVPCGITPENANALIRDLLARRTARN